MLPIQVSCVPALRAAILFLLRSFDILVLTEVQATFSQLLKVPALAKILEKYSFAAWNSSVCTNKQRQYSGTSIWCRLKPISVSFGFRDNEEEDKLGRIVVVRYSDVTIVGLYCPSTTIGLHSLEQRAHFDRRLLDLLVKERHVQKVLILGDFNVAPTSSDISDYTPFGTGACGDIQRETFKRILACTSTLDPGSKTNQLTWFPDQYRRHQLTSFLFLNNGMFLTLKH